MNQIRLCLSLLLLAACGTARPAFARSGGELAISFVDAETKAPLAVRVELRTANGRLITRKTLGILTDHRRMYVDGSATWKLPVGQYRFFADAGPEYRTQNGSFEIQPFAADEKVVELNRFANLAEEGWYAADIDVQLPAKALDVARRATQEPIVPDGERWPSDSGLILGFGKLGDLAGKTKMPSDELLTAVREREGINCVLIDHWDLPLLVADELVDAIDLLHKPLEGTGIKGPPIPIDLKMYGGQNGYHRWRESVYFHLLNSGVRIPVLAGTGAGLTGIPLGSNCVYAFAPAKPTESEWWDAALAGRTVVTNGPLLRPSANGQPPGYVFSMAKGDELEVAIGLNLATRTSVEYLEIIQNGEVLSATPLAAWAKNKGKLPVLTFKESGWFAVRAVTTDPKKYQLALSAPWYVEVDSKPFISKRSVQFFLDWLKHRRKKSPGNADRYTRAESFWRERLGEANAD